MSAEPQGAVNHHCWLTAQGFTQNLKATLKHYWCVEFVDLFAHENPGHQHFGLDPIRLMSG